MLPDFVAFLAALAPLSYAAPGNSARHVLHERREESSDWVKRGSLHRDALLPMRIGLPQSNLHRGHDWLMEVSDPTSSKYGNYYTAEEIHDLFAPSENSVDAVRSWLEAAGIHATRISQSANKQWIQFDAGTAEAESLLKTKFHLYEHTPTGRMTVGCDEYHVHEDVRSHVDYITPGIKPLTVARSTRAQKEKRMIFPEKSPRLSRLEVIEATKTGNLSNCGGSITANCVLAMYNITLAETAQPGNELGVFEDMADYIDSEDLNGFFTLYAPRIPNGTFPTVKGVDGGRNFNNRAGSSFETALDLEISYPIIYPQKSVLFLADDPYYSNLYNDPEDAPKGFFNTFLDAIDGSYCNYSAFGETGDSKIDPQYPDPHKGGYKGQLQCGVYKPTNVITFSYNYAETGSGIPHNYQQRQCNEFMKLGMQGVSLVFSSGDFGVAAENGCLGANKKVFSPEYPSNCPYITAVGGTQLPFGASAAKDEEVATNDFPSGGGFSNVYPRPSYQKNAVEAYFNSAAAPKYPFYTGSSMGNGIYNRSGRGYPDVAANGGPILISAKGYDEVLIGGTSASAPIFAGILTRINDARLAAGMPTIGFVNPTLYQNPHAFHDITSGNNSACHSAGFLAGHGWDPVTGLGTPNFPVLMEVFMKSAPSYPS